jgi:hypothetical protein
MLIVCKEVSFARKRGERQELTIWIEEVLCARFLYPRWTEGGINKISAEDKLVLYPRKLNRAEKTFFSYIRFPRLTGCVARPVGRLIWRANLHTQTSKQLAFTGRMMGVGGLVSLHQ